MRRSFSRRLGVLVLAVFISLPLSAAPRKDDSQPGTIVERIVKFVRHLLPLEDIKGTWPIP